VLAFFIQDLREGGAERSVARLLNGIVARNITADLVVVNRIGSFFSELDPRVKVVELPQRRTMTSMLGLKSYIDTRRPAALISSQTHTNVAAILANVMARRRTRLVVVEHNQYSMNRALKHGPVAIAYRLVPWVYRKADLVAAVSVGVRDDLAAETGLPAGRIAVLHNPVVSRELEERASAPVDHPWLNEPGPPVVLSVGRFTKQKNFSLLIEAFARLRRERPVRLIILGEGELRSELEACVRFHGVGEDVDLPGFDPNPFRFMRPAGIYVLSSDWEGLPTALIEAMACGTPVVSTDCAGGPREILLDGRLGTIVPRGDVGALTTAMAATLDARGDRQARIARALEFGVERAVDRYLQAAAW
jgi:glycosyltransferase involved in cell wall biosynthesis